MLGRCSAAALEEEGGRYLALEWAEAVLWAGFGIDRGEWEETRCCRGRGDQEFTLMRRSR